MKKKTKIPQVFRLREEIVDLLKKHSEKTSINKTRLVELAIMDYLKKGKSFKQYAALQVKSDDNAIASRKTSLRIKQMKKAADKMRRLITEVELLMAV